MTKRLSTQDLSGVFPEAMGFDLAHGDANELRLRPDQLLEVCCLLKETPGFDMDYLTSITAVDYIENFEVIYHLVSLKNNQSLVLKINIFDRESPVVPSVSGLWMGAHLQEREIWDLMGIRFSGHPNLKRILTWEGFPGHALRKDYASS